MFWRNSFLPLLTCTLSTYHALSPTLGLGDKAGNKANSFSEEGFISASDMLSGEN